MSKWIFEPIWSYKYDRGLLDPNVDYQVIGFGRLFGIIKDKYNDYKLRHPKLGKVKYFNKDHFLISGMSPDVAWQMDRYLAVIIRDYLRFHINNSPVIGNCVLRDNPEGIPYEDFLFNRDNSDVDYGQRWRELVLNTAYDFDEIIRLMESAPPYPKDYEKVLQEKIDAAFKELAYIYRDLSW